jgi:hypothetical protein
MRMLSHENALAWECAFMHGECSGRNIIEIQGNKIKNRTFAFATAILTV